jgi:rhodanese-related sulfurtransferase
MIKFSSGIISLILVFLFFNPGMSERIPTPTEPPDGVKVISIHEAIELTSKKAYLFDTRREISFMSGHLPGAVSLPLVWTKRGLPEQRRGSFDLTRLPADKNTPVILYSHGANGWKSYYASKIARDAGYENVMWLRGGLNDWVKSGYSLEK